MTAALTVAPAEPATDQVVLVTLTGAGDYRTRLLLDAVVANTSICYITGGTGSGSITMGSVAGTQTVSAEQMIAGVWTEVATLPVDVSAAAVDTYTGSTLTEFVEALKETSIDVLQIATAALPDWQGEIWVSRKFRPLLVRPAAGVGVVWDGSGLGSGVFGPLMFGANPSSPGFPSFVTDYITFDPAGTGGSFAIQNFDIGQAGLALLGWTDHLTLNGFNCHDNVGLGGSFSHNLYVNSDHNASPFNAGHHATNTTANDWVIVGDVARSMNGVQTFHNPNVIGLTLDGWDVQLLNRWAFLYGDASGIALSNWDGANCNATIDSPAISSSDHATGTVTGCDGHGSCGPIAVGSGSWVNTGITNGGGNTP